MKKLFTFLLSACMCTLVMAQRPTGEIVKAGDAKPVIDGTIDDVWATANKYNVDKAFRTEVPTFGDEGTTYWKALWDESGMYVLVVANDDAWFPFWAPGGGSNGWEYDKVEMYFDTNYLLEDGKGGQATTGNRQIAPDSDAGGIDGTAKTTAVNGYDVSYAYKVADPTWAVEYFVPWDAIPDQDGVLFDKTGTMGFDITLIDRDPGDAARKRAQWANVGDKDENWNNMDDAGHLTFLGAEEQIYVDKVTANGGSITTDNGTLQLTATIEPADASNQKLRWTVTNGTGKASINAATGVLTAIANGTVMVKASATDGGWAESDAVEITISGQVIDKNDVWNSLNKITNWNFENGKSGDWPTSWGGWVDGAVADQVVPAIEDGVAVMKVGLSTAGEAWHYQLNQSNLTCEANVPYTLKFKSWASADATPCVVDFESASAAGVDQYSRYGSSTDPEAVNGGSEWNYSVNTTPTWFTFHVVFDKMIDGTIQKIQWMNSLSNETVYLDSVILIKDEDMALYTINNKLAQSSFKVYPNPVGNSNVLTVNLDAANQNVAIYNSVGQKLMEKVAVTTTVRFDVANLRKGMYFVRLSDGTTQKFMR